MKQKPYTLLQALEKARKYCAYQDRCQQEVKQKLYRWGISKNDTDEIIAQLITENFINEERFAKNYARGKFRIKKWGKKRIIYELKQRNISEYCIKQALKEIDTQEYQDTLLQLIEKNIELTKNLKDKEKLIRKLLYKGYEYELIENCLHKTSR